MNRMTAPKPTDTDPMNAEERRRVFQTARAISRDVHLAEDITQEIAMKLMTTPIPQDVKNRIGWLNRVAARTTLNHLRADQRRRAREETTGPGPKRGEIENLSRLEELEYVRSELEGLDDDLRLPLILRYFNDFKLREIADILKMPLTTVQSRLDRGLNLLEQRLQTAGIVSAAAVLPERLAEIPGSLPAAAPAVAAVGAAGGGFLAGAWTKIMAFFFGSAALMAVLAQWDDNPFEGTVAIEVRMQNGDTTTFKDPDTVEALIDKLVVTSIMNNIAMGSIPPGFVTFHKKDGDPVRMTIESATTLQGLGGIIHIKPGFTQALSHEMTKALKKKVDVTKFDMSHLKSPEPVTLKELAEKSWLKIKTGYAVGDSWREAFITQQDHVAAIAKSWSVVSRIPKDQPGGDSESWCPSGFNVNLEITLEDGRTWSVIHTGPRHIRHFDLGVIELSEPFVEAISKAVADLTGRAALPGQVLEETEENLGQAESIRSWLKACTSAIVRKGELTAHLGADDLKKIWESDYGRFRIFIPGSGTKMGDTQDFEIILKGSDGVSRHLQIHEAGDSIAVHPVCCDLMRVEGVGTFWGYDQWVHKFDAALREEKNRQDEARHLEDSRVVFDNFEEFLGHVKNLTVHYRKESGGCFTSFYAEPSQIWVKGLKVVSVTRIDQPMDWWKKALKPHQDGDGGCVQLVPGTGFDFVLIPVAANEAWVVGVGKIVFEGTPWRDLAKIMEPKNHEEIHFLPAKID